MLCYMFDFFKLNMYTAIYAVYAHRNREKTAKILFYRRLAVPPLNKLIIIYYFIEWYNATFD